MRPDDDFETINIAEFSSQDSRPPGSNSEVVGVSTKIVVADTSPLNYLVQIKGDFLLPLLYRRVIAPPVVVAELTHIGAPSVVAEWAAQPPAWLEVLPTETQPDEKLCLLDAGERDAIQLAIELHASEVLIDEFKGRREARTRGFSIVGTLGVLIAGQQEHLINAHDAFEQLITQTNFRLTPQLRQTFLEFSRPHIRRQLTL